MEQYKHSPEVRAYFAKAKREYRAKEKAKAAQASPAQAALARQSPKEIANVVP
jgi:hypothetical protein